MTLLVLQDDMGRVRHDYENILEEKLALDTEIAVYRGLIEAEERRLARYTHMEPDERRLVRYTHMEAEERRLVGYTHMEAEERRLVR